MGTVNLIYDYFPELTEEQRERFARLEGLYREWNEKINVISRKIWMSFGYIMCCITGDRKDHPFAPGTRVMDVGTGGGFPGIPLAILFPEVNFYLIDSIGKKIKVVEGFGMLWGYSMSGPSRSAWKMLRNNRILLSAGL